MRKRTRISESLIGNFTGQADFLHQREVVDGNPKVYGHLVQILAQYKRVLKDREPEAAHTAAAAAATDATDAFAATTAAPPTAGAAPRKTLRMRKIGNPTADDAPV